MAQTAETQMGTIEIGARAGALSHHPPKALIGLGFFAALTLILTLPLALDLDHRFVSWLIDPPFTMWTMAWQAHAIQVDPAAFFDANIFYPERGALAFSSLNFAPMLAALPILQASSNPILAYNFVYLFAWWLIGFGTFVLARMVGLGVGPSLLAGALAEFSPFTFGQLGHLEILWVGWIPLFLVAAHSLLKRGKPIDFALALIFFLLQSLATWYFAIYLTLVATGLVLFTARRSGWLSWRRWGGVAAVVAFGWVLMLPLLVPYLRVEPGYAKVRTLDQAQYYSASLDSYFREPAYNQTWRALLGTGDQGESNLFPGIVFALLAVIGIPRVWSDNRAGMRGRLLILIGVASIVLTFGPTLQIDSQSIISLPENLLRSLPGYALTRVPARWAIFAVIAFAVCAGVGAQRISRGRPVILVALFVVALIENFSVPLPTSTLPTWEMLEPEYRWLAAQPSRVVAELPMRVNLESRDAQVGYVYRSIFHHQRLINGYADYIPDWYAEALSSSKQFPSPDTLALYRQLGVQLIVAHIDQIEPEAHAAILEMLDSETSPIRLAATFGDTMIFQLKQTP